MMEYMNRKQHEAERQEVSILLLIIILIRAEKEQSDKTIGDLPDICGSAMLIRAAPTPSHEL